MNNSKQYTLQYCRDSRPHASFSTLQASLAFPAVLERLKLAPFDLSKLVQPFQRAVPRLPSQLTRHLFLIEERILEVRLQ